MAKQLFTFGYEGLSIDAFLSRLTEEGVGTIVDVRANPISRKRGFSKRSFAAALNSVGVAYLHLPTLGCPKPIRDRYKIDENWAAYTKGFLAHLKTQSEVVSQLAKLAKTSPTCLVCFEADFTQCHRTYVARAASSISNLTVAHLTAQTVIPDTQLHSAA
ncbi:DUF488 domain-containing protein [Rhodopseudomonas sp. WA056]|uniref:DUF488 domain-containing protein n=1 Tax=Rhodopseudomonas sp. WA056 TaxID=2269367 RepID=UPI0013DFC028|nr:DUF488 domain-containing protein [Rhodopseudomonas sp. WA056]NEW90119.1 DUF488 domain-containing protein [Rhodopseudomonas sp. WA056]